MTSLFAFPENANATCVNYLESQTIAAAYSGDIVPTVNTMDTCSGDDVSYEIPIATTITFDGVQYDRVYATTNSVITFGQPDYNWWDYPTTPSISLYSMDWYAGINNASNGLDIYYSNGGFQINLQAIPFGQWNAEASNINILVAITNTGGISVSYSYQGPQYSNLRTGVRLHDGSVVSLEAWGATQVQSGSTTLQSNVTTVGPTQQEIAAQEEARVVNSLIAAAVGTENLITPEPTPTSTPITEPTTNPEPDIVVEPEIITPGDSRMPDNNEQTQPSEPTPAPSSDTTNTEIPNPTPEPSVEPSPQPTDINPTPTPEPTSSPSQNFDKTKNTPVSSEMANLIADLTNSNTLSKLTPEQKNAVAGTLGIKTNEIEKIANLAKSDKTIAKALEEFGIRANENLNAPMPYTLADATTEINTEKILSDPMSMFTNIDLQKVLNPSEWGKDMTDDQREKVQEIVVPVIIASNIVAASMTRRIK